MEPLAQLKADYPVQTHQKGVFIRFKKGAYLLKFSV